MSAEMITGDCRAVLPTLALDPARTVVLTDPPWPNASPELLAQWSVRDPEDLWMEVAPVLARMARRVIVVLGCQSEPTCFSLTPWLLFVRVVWLPYGRPSYQGTVLNSGDVAYVWGDRAAEGTWTLLPGTGPQSRGGQRRAFGLRHPCPRPQDHARWLVSRFTAEGDTVLDPFAGSGTYVAAAHALGRVGLGIDCTDYRDDFARLTSQQHLDLARDGTGSFEMAPTGQR